MTPERVWSSHSLPVTDLHLGVGGHLSRVVSSSLDQTCRLFDVNSGELLCTFVFEVGICSVVLDPAEFRLFAGSSSGSIYAVNLFETVSVSGGTSDSVYTINASFILPQPYFYNQTRTFCFDLVCSELSLVLHIRFMIFNEDNEFMMKLGKMCLYIWLYII